MRVLAVAALALALALAGCLRGIVGGDGSAGPRDYVSSKQYTKWVVEVDTIEGMAPPSSAMSLLQQRLNSVASKPDGIEIRTDGSLKPRGGTWSLKDITDHSSAHLDAQTGGKTAVLHLLFLDGRYTESNVLGVTVSRVRDNGEVVSSGPIAIFSEAIRGSCTLATLCTDPTPIWGPVLVHEFGHAMGLVNNGIPMVSPHEDGGHPGHSDNRNSVMYWAVETSDILTTFTGGIPSDFDADDRADLCAAGGKCP